jgi:hypothetical protein
MCRPLFRELWQLNLASRCWTKIQMQVRVVFLRVYTLGGPLPYLGNF